MTGYNEFPKPISEDLLIHCSWWPWTMELMDILCVCSKRNNVMLRQEKVGKVTCAGGYIIMTAISL